MLTNANQYFVDLKFLFILNFYLSNGIKALIQPLFLYLQVQ